MSRKQHFHPSNVDESLFGNSKPKRVQRFVLYLVFMVFYERLILNNISAPSSRKPVVATATYITSSDLEKIKVLFLLDNFVLAIIPCCSKRQ